MKYTIENTSLGSESVTRYTITTSQWEAVFITRQGVLHREIGNTSNRYAIRAFTTLRNLGSISAEANLEDLINNAQR